MAARIRDRNHADSGSLSASARQIDTKSNGGMSTGGSTIVSSDGSAALCTVRDATVNTRSALRVPRINCRPWLPFTATAWDWRRQSDGVVAETFVLAVNQSQQGPNNRRLGFQSNHLIKVQNVANFAAPQPMYPAETLTDHTIRMRRFVYFVL